MTMRFFSGESVSFSTKESLTKFVDSIWISTPIEQESYRSFVRVTARVVQRSHARISKSLNVRPVVHQVRSHILVSIPCPKEHFDRTRIITS